jgi:enterochelin esterase-like enzyme
MARRTAPQRVRLPTLQPVGVGGLEPPTSASQTRRASRLRYTPADKSIIRMMLNRQAFTTKFTPGCLLFFSLFVYVLTGCSPMSGELPVGPYQPPTPTQPAPTPEPQTGLLPKPSSTPPSDCLAAGGTLETHTINSEWQETEFRFQVYLPPCYLSDPQERYPVMYLLHGLSYQEDQWVRLGLVEQMDKLIADSEISPFIIVLPHEVIYQTPQASTFPHLIVQELVSWIDDHYATNTGKDFRGIGGLSRGAAWAVQIGFENTDLFSRIGAHSLPLFQADGGNLIRWFTQEPADELPSVFIDIGRDDKEWQSAKNFADLLDQYHIPHEWYFFKNGHTEDYWSEHLEQYLRWYARDW